MTQDATKLSMPTSLPLEAAAAPHEAANAVQSGKRRRVAGKSPTNAAAVVKAARQPPPPSVCPFTIIIDTREQLPLTFAAIQADASQDKLRRPLQIQTVRCGLPAGDYSIVGYDGTSVCDGLKSFTTYEAGISIERKSLADLYGTLGQSRARFTRELERLSLYSFSAVVVESDWPEILSAAAANLTRSRLNPKTIYRSVIAWQQRYPKTHWWMCAGRGMAEVTVFRILEKWWTERQRRGYDEAATRVSDNVVTMP